MNNYHKIIGSAIFGFDDFSILKIEGKYADDLKGNYETFSQFLSIPDNFDESFIVWEGYIDEVEPEPQRNNKIFIYDGRLRNLTSSEFLLLNKKSQMELPSSV